MHFVQVDKSPVEHVQYVEENKMEHYAKTWINLNQAHEITIVKAGSHYYVKVYFSPYEYCYIASFDSEKAAKHYVHEILD